MNQLLISQRVAGINRLSGYLVTTYLLNYVISHGNINYKTKVLRNSLNSISDSICANLPKSATKP